MNMIRWTVKIDARSNKYYVSNVTNAFNLFRYQQIVSELL